MYNHSMTHQKTGFTIIEVMLVLAIASLVAIMVMVGVSTSIARQRYADSVNGAADYVRQAYAEVINVQNPRLGDLGSHAFCTITTAVSSEYQASVTRISQTDNHPGRSNCIIYGKLITFGEVNPDTNKPDTIAHTYDVLGGDLDFDKDTNPPTTTLEALSRVGANIVSINSTPETCSLSYAGNHNNYAPAWSASIESGSAERRLFTGAILIVRSPITGTVHTYSSEEPFDVMSVLKTENIHLGTNPCNNPTEAKSRYATKGDLLLAGALKNGKFTSTSRTFCVGSDDTFAGIRRRAIRIDADGRNSSAVEILPADSEESIRICQ